MKVVINTCYGGFCLSEKAMKLLIKKVKDRKTKERLKEYYKEIKKQIREFRLFKDTFNPPVSRGDPALVEVVEELGAEANCKFSKLKVVEIPDDVEWQIEEYDGMEWVAEKHRVWK